MEFKAEPYTLRLSPNYPETEKDFRENLNLSWCNSALFNVEAIDNRAPLGEYDAILWNEEEKAILFIEYKNSSSANKNLKEHRAQQIKASSRNIARAFGFRWYNFIIVVKSNELSKDKKGDAAVILLDELQNYSLNFERDNPVYTNGEKEIEFESTLEELALTDRLLKKYENTENPIDVAGVIKDLEKLKMKIDEMNK
jgi:hypothetical protein